MGVRKNAGRSSSAGLLTRTEKWLVGGGEMGKLIRSMDWNGSPLGPIENWPQSLRTTVSLCLSSNFPISLAWGPRHIQIYNDGYWPICGGKHPYSMGQDFAECWAAPWPVIGEAFERALGGKTSYLENQRMFLDRNGYLEETCFTFSFSPIRDESGGVGGLFHPVTETTSRMLTERRTRALRDLAAQAGKARTIDEACSLAAQTLAEFELDLPFVLFYMFDELGAEARLTASSGLLSETPANAAAIKMDSTTSPGWPLLDVRKTGQVQSLDDLVARFGHLPCGPYPEPVREALALPVLLPGYPQPAGVMVAGVSPRLRLNETYRAFYELLAASVTAAVANARAYEQERKRAEALAEIDRAKTAFFSNVSHEFRTPLTLMLGPLEDELAEIVNPLPAARRDRLETAHRNSLRLLKLVNSLLDFSRIEARRMQASYEPTDLAHLTTELASVFRSGMEKAGLTLTIVCPPLPEPVYVDREMWEKIVLNLLSNAFKHTFEGGVSVNLHWLGDHVELIVADTGVGIPQDALPRVFERFHRVKGAKSRTHEGTGIGLALVKELVALHKGSVRVESKENHGSKFSVKLKTSCKHLPAQQPSAKIELASTSTRAAAYVGEALQWLPEQTTPEAVTAAPRSAPEALRTREAVASGEKRARILWADDNSDMRDYVTRLLASRYDVLAVPDGLKALVAAEASAPDLILSDVMMPGLDGFGLLREIRKSSRTKTIPMILLSARAGEEAAVEGLDAGADDYLVKPFTARELLARVQTHLKLSRVRREWAEELEQANQELETSNKELEAFSYSASHDLRGPLTAMHGFADLLVEKYSAELSESPLKYVKRIKEAANRMTGLIDDLLKLSRVKRQELFLADVALDALMKEVMRELKPEAAHRKIQWHVGTLPVIRCDYGLMKQVFVNLLSNAIKYTRPRNPAAIEVAEETISGERVLFVRDNGVGFDMKTAEKLFQPFQRLHRAEAFEGTGIGLATVKRVIEKHGGRVWVNSELEKGATFYFTVSPSQRKAARAGKK